MQSKETLLAWWNEKFSKPVEFGNIVYLTDNSGMWSKEILNDSCKFLAETLVKSLKSYGFEPDEKNVVKYIAKFPNLDLSDPLSLCSPAIGIKVNTENVPIKLDLEGIFNFAITTIRNLKSEVSELKQYDFREAKDEKDLIAKYNAWIDSD